MFSSFVVYSKKLGYDIAIMNGFVVLPVILVDQLNISLVNHWKIYVSSLIVSLLFSVPMIINDRRMGKKIFLTPLV